jgi:hypothetical protein
VPETNISAAELVISVQLFILCVEVVVVQQIVLTAHLPIIKMVPHVLYVQINVHLVLIQLNARHVFWDTTLLLTLADHVLSNVLLVF